MSIPHKYHVPAVTALWMIALPLVFWVFGGAGLGTMLDGLARFLQTMFDIYGGPSLIFGFLLLGWTAWQAWRDGSLVVPLKAHE